MVKNITNEPICNNEDNMVAKRIYNPVTGKYYEVRQRSSKYGEAGEIKGLWSSKKKKTR
ncbi:MAG: hypothetical protein O8C64_14530 [Candidatus Methanoperedens sp.]|nr:hypothetical protein [Candidatus Methanoperedens sp.]MCZ7404661.1 hypothetical protein [Candidatus Methanoperedens sp.]